MQFSQNDKQFIHTLAEELSSHEILSEMYRQGVNSVPMPSVQELSYVVESLREVLFPGYFGSNNMRNGSIKYSIGSILDEIYEKLAIQIKYGYCFACDKESRECKNCDNLAKEVVGKLLNKLPEIRHLLAADALAAYNGDPASHSVGEVIFCYPSVRAVTNFRIAHELYVMNVPLIPRIISELAHSETGIDIHPGATIDKSFFIDHGTGVVIGETCRIGENVRLYMGVTLGAKSFPLDKDGNPLKGIDRHPKVEDNVVIYSGATILGNITIGSGSEIGGNVWLTDDVPPNSRVRASFNIEAR